MKLINNKENTQTEFDFTGTVTQLLAHLNINAETVIIAVNDQLVGDDHTIENQDTVTMYSVISGG